MEPAISPRPPKALTRTRSSTHRSRQSPWRCDTDAALAIVGDDEVTAWLSFDSYDRTRTAAMLTGTIERARQEPRTEYYLAFTLPESDELIGFARLGLNGVQAAKLGFAIRPNQWGHGYATDAARTIIEFGFRELKLHRISAAIGPDNAPSIAVAAKLGFQNEGRIRDHVHTNGKWRDSLLYSILVNEWNPAAAKGPGPSQEPSHA